MSRPTASASARKRAARLAAAQVLYALEVGSDDVDREIAHFLERQDGQVADPGDEASPAGKGGRMVPVDRPLLIAIVRAAWEARERLDETLDQILNRPGGLGRMEAVLRAILRAGAAEIMVIGEVDPPIVIRDHVEVADSFFGGSEPGLVNACLDRLARLVRPEAMRDPSAAG